MIKCNNECPLEKFDGCCHSCPDIETCKDACESNPETCGESTFDEEADDNLPKTRKRRKLNRYERKYIERKRLSEIYEESWHPVWYDKDSQRYKRCYYSGRKGFAKRQSNRKIRHTKDFDANGGMYRKLYDYWWNVF